MNIAAMMKQAQQMQKKLQDVQGELSSLEISAEAGNGAVKVVYDGQGKFKSIKLTAQAINAENPETVDEDAIEMLEDLITTAINHATKEAEAKKEAKMSGVTGGLNIPGLF